MVILLFIIQIYSLSPHSSVDQVLFLNEISLQETETSVNIFESPWVSICDSLNEEGYLQGYSPSFFLYLIAKNRPLPDTCSYPYHFLKFHFPFIDMNKVERFNKLSTSLFYKHLIGTFQIIKQATDPPYTFTERYNHSENLRNLVNIITLARADPNAPSNLGFSLSIACASVPENKQTLDILHVLLNSKADPNAPESSYRTISFKEAELRHQLLRGYFCKNLDCPLALSIEMQNYQSASLLLQHNANPNEVLNNGNTVLIYFLSLISKQESLPSQKEIDRLRLFDSFLEADPDLLYQNLNGETALHIIYQHSWLDPQLHADILIKISDYLLLHPLPLGHKLVQDTNGSSPFLLSPSIPTSALEATPFLAPFENISTNFDDMHTLLEHLQSLPTLSACFLCLARTFPILEHPQTAFSHSFFISQLKCILSHKIKKEKLSPTQFLQLYTHLEIPFDHLILFSLVLTQDENSVVSHFCKALLLEIKQHLRQDNSLSQLPLSPRSIFFLKLFISNTHTNQSIHIDTLAIAMIQKKTFAYPLILMLSSQNSLLLLKKMSEKGYQTAIYNPRDIIPRMMEMALYKNVGFSIGKTRDIHYQRNLSHIRTTYKQMKEQITPLYRLKDIVSKEDSIHLPDNPSFEVYGRSITFCVNNQQYSLKLRKKSETNDQFLDGAVINWGLQNKLEVIERQFAPTRLVQLDLALFNIIKAEIAKQEEFKDIELTPEAYVIPTYHTSYFQYLVSPQKDPYQSRPEKEQKQRTSHLIEGLKRNMTDYSYLAQHNLFLNDLTSNSHGKDRCYNFAHFYSFNDLWRHGAGVFSDIIGGTSLSNMGKKGLRDLGNLMNPRALAQEILTNGLSDEGKKILHLFSDDEKEQIQLNTYSQTLVEHFFSHYTTLLVALHEEREILINFNEDIFKQVILEYIIDPFLDEHFKNTLHLSELHSFKQHVHEFLDELIKKDWHFFKNDPEIIKEAIMRNGARDFPLQNVYTGLARIVSLVNLKEAGHLPSFYILPAPHNTISPPPSQVSQYKYQKICNFLLKSPDILSYPYLASDIMEDIPSFICYMHQPEFDFLKLTDRLLFSLRTFSESSFRRRPPFALLIQELIFSLIEKDSRNELQTLLQQIDQYQFTNNVFTKNFIIKLFYTYGGKQIAILLPHFNSETLHMLSPEDFSSSLSNFGVLDKKSFFIFLEHLQSIVTPQTISSMLSSFLQRQDYPELFNFPFFWNYFKQHRSHFIKLCCYFPELFTYYNESLKEELEFYPQNCYLEEISTLTQLATAFKALPGYQCLLTYFELFILKQNNIDKKQLILSFIRNIEDGYLFYLLLIHQPQIAQKHLTYRFLIKRSHFLTNFELFNYLYQNNQKLLLTLQPSLETLSNLNSHLYFHQPSNQPKLTSISKELSFGVFDTKTLCQYLNSNKFKKILVTTDLIYFQTSENLEKVLSELPFDLISLFLNKILMFYMNPSPPFFNPNVRNHEYDRMMATFQILVCYIERNDHLIPTLINSLFDQPHSSLEQLKHFFALLDQSFHESPTPHPVLSHPLFRKKIKKQLSSFEEITFKELCHPDSNIYSILKRSDLLKKDQWLLSFFLKDFKSQILLNNSSSPSQANSFSSLLTPLRNAFLSEDKTYKEVQDYLNFNGKDIIQQLEICFRKGRDPVSSFIELYNKGFKWKPRHMFKPSMATQHTYRLSDILNYIFFHTPLPFSCHSTVRPLPLLSNLKQKKLHDITPITINASTTNEHISSSLLDTPSLVSSCLQQLEIVASLA